MSPAPLIRAVSGEGAYARAVSKIIGRLGALSGFISGALIGAFGLLLIWAFLFFLKRSRSAMYCFALHSSLSRISLISLRIVFALWTLSMYCPLKKPIPVKKRSVHAWWQASKWAIASSFIHCGNRARSDSNFCLLGTAAWSLPSAARLLVRMRSPSPPLLSSGAMSWFR